MGFRLDAEAAAHVVVALDDVEVVALRATKQDCTEEDALLQPRQGSHLGQRKDKARSEGSSFADAIGSQVGAVLYWFRVVVVEVLVDTEFKFRKFLTCQF